MRDKIRKIIFNGKRIAVISLADKGRFYVIYALFLYPIQFRNRVMMPVFIMSTNMAPMIGTMRKGFTE